MPQQQQSTNQLTNSRIIFFFEFRLTFLLKSCVYCFKKFWASLTKWKSIFHSYKKNQYKWDVVKFQKKERILEILFGIYCESLEVSFDCHSLFYFFFHFVFSFVQCPLENSLYIRSYGFILHYSHGWYVTEISSNHRIHSIIKCKKKTDSMDYVFFLFSMKLHMKTNGS